jgi:hypothetical protein
VISYGKNQISADSDKLRENQISQFYRYLITIKYHPSTDILRYQKFYHFTDILGYHTYEKAFVKVEFRLDQMPDRKNARYIDLITT